MKLNQIKNVLSKISNCPSKWELDSITYYDRTSNPATLVSFLNRIQELENKKTKATADEKQELGYLTDLLADLEESDCLELINRDDDECRDAFIETLARTSAIEVITDGKLSFNTMNTSCKLSPNDFILTAKRTQDLINAIQGLVIKGETLSQDIAGT